MKYLILLLALSGAIAHGATYYVDNIKGCDTNPGTLKSPVKSIEQGIKLLKTSDRLEVINTGKPYQRPYPGPVGRGLHVRVGGTFDIPLIINGNGAVLTGLAVIPPEQWKVESERVYSLSFNPMSNRFRNYKQQNHWLEAPQIWWVNGQPAPNCKNAKELMDRPGGFFWDKLNKMVYFHLPPAKALTELKVELPANFGFYITADHTVIRDFYFTHSWNDGFDASGKNQNGVYKNCIAIDNCGQGFSSHNSSNIYFEDCAAIRCASSGVCDVNDSNTRYHRVILMDNVFEAGVYTTHEGVHTFSDSLIINNQPFEQLWQHGTSTQIYDNCVIIGRGDDSSILKMQHGTVAFRNCTIANAADLVSVATPFSGNLTVENSLLVNFKNHVIFWDADIGGLRFTGNLLGNSPGIMIKNKSFQRDNWAEFFSFYGKDYSQWLSHEYSVTQLRNPLSMKNHQGKEVKIGADLPPEVWARYEKLKTIRATPDGIKWD